MWLALFTIIGTLAGVAGTAYSIKSSEAAKKRQQAAIAEQAAPPAYSLDEQNFAKIATLNDVVQSADNDNATSTTQAVNASVNAQTWVWYAVLVVVGLVGWRMVKKYIL